MFITLVIVYKTFKPFQMKYCKGCDTTKALTEFYKNSRHRDGLASRCKVCRSARNKKWYQNKNVEEIIADASKWQQNNTEKYCKGCNQTKALTEFSKSGGRRDGLQTRCKVCRKNTRQNYRKKENARARKHYQNNPEKRRASKRKYRKNNREKERASQRKRNKRPETKKRVNARRRERRKTDPPFRILCNLRCRLWHALKGKNKSARTMKLVGCSIPHLMDHLEKQFLPGMTWENYGPVWHVDHMMPCDSFDLSDPEQQRRSFHYTNLQPLWGPENMSKGDTILYNRVWNGTRWIN